MLKKININLFCPCENAWAKMAFSDTMSIRFFRICNPKTLFLQNIQIPRYIITGHKRPKSGTAPEF
jgi:hypothetical protein